MEFGVGVPVHHTGTPVAFR